MNDAHSLYCILVMAGLVRAIHVRAIHASPQPRAGRRHVDARNKFAHDERGPGHSLRRSAVVALAALGLLAGCTYLDQRQDLMQGGPWNRIATANTSLQAAKTQNQDLQDQQLQTEREIERNNRRMEKTQADLDRVSAELEAARKRKQISEAEYQRLKREVATANGDLSSVNMQLDAGRVTGTIDNPDKERQIKALENKKGELEKALGMSPRP